MEKRGKKRKHEELQKSWEELNKKFEKMSGAYLNKKRCYTDRKETKKYKRADSSHIPSLDTGVSMCIKKENQRYTGGSIKGIGMLHKSNLVPVFTDEEAKDQANMRR